MKPLVSICCLAYNHEKYIKKCLEGFLMQQANFAFEVLIHDDASADKTTLIIEEFEHKYPTVVKPIYQSENQYSKVGGLNIKFNFPRAQGKYIAMCEGDDYWIDPLKLQKQVDFLENNLGYNFVCGGFISYNSLTQVEKKIIKKPPTPDTKIFEDGFEITLQNMKQEWLTKTLTTLFRKDSLNFDILKKYKHRRDINLFYHLAKAGKGFYFPELFGVYNVHEGGINSLKKGLVNNRAAYYVYKELYEYNSDDFTRIMNLMHTLNFLHYSIYNNYEGNSINSKVNLFKEAVNLIGSFKEYTFLVTAFLPENFKKFLRK